MKDINIVKFGYYSSLSFAIVTATVLLIAYFVQFAVIPISMMKGETEGIALLNCGGKNKEITIANFRLF